MIAEGVHYPIRLRSGEEVEGDAPYKWFADIYSLNLADHLPTLTGGDGVTIINDGRRVEAFIVEVYRTDLAQIAGKGDPPWQ